MSAENTNRVFNKLYANRVVVRREEATIANLSLIFVIIAFLTAPWLVIGGAIAAVALGYKFSYRRADAAFTSNVDTVIRDAKNNVRSVVDAVTEHNSQN